MGPPHVLIIVKPHSIQTPARCWNAEWTWRALTGHQALSSTDRYWTRGPRLSARVAGMIERCRPLTVFVGVNFPANRKPQSALTCSSLGEATGSATPPGRCHCAQQLPFVQPLYVGTGPATAGSVPGTRPAYQERSGNGVAIIPDEKKKVASGIFSVVSGWCMHQCCCASVRCEPPHVRSSCAIILCAIGRDHPPFSRALTGGQSGQMRCLHEPSRVVLNGLRVECHG